jgi:signal transduction histidine kinase
MRVAIAACLLFLLELVPGCQRAPERWRQAERQWQEGRLLSAGYAEWVALDGATPEGQKARQRLAEASVHYRRALALLQRGGEGAREELDRGKEVAPLDPALFLPLARACRAKELPFMAMQFYSSYLDQAPAEPELSAARQELAELVGKYGPIWGQPSPEKGDRGLLAKAPPAIVLSTGVAFGLLLALGLSSLGPWRRRSRSLAELAATYPELQPALAYLIGRLRHELLKHRIGAAADVAQALAAGQSSAEMRVFLHRKLYGGERLGEAWRGYLHSFRRALGPDFDLSRSDRGFAVAQRAVCELEAIELPLLRGERAAVRKLVASHRRLQDFDRGLAELVTRLQRTPLDKALIEQAVAAVRSEHLAGQVVLDVVELFGPPEPVCVAVYRTDLLLVLKNLLRNAILAAGRAPPPRQIAVDAMLDLLPTGEEVVRLRVHDSSPEPLTAEQIYRSGDAEPTGSQHGLGLVTAALGLYSGSISVEPGRPGYCKCVVVQLFRTLELGEGPGS